MPSWLGKPVRDPRFEHIEEPREFDTIVRRGAHVNDVLIFPGGVAIVQVNGKPERFFVKQIVGVTCQGVWLYTLESAVKCVLKWHKGRVEENAIEKFIFKTFVSGPAADEEWLVFSDHTGEITCDMVNEMETVAHLGQYERCRNVQLLLFDSYLSFEKKQISRVEMTTRCTTHFCFFLWHTVTSFIHSIEILAAHYRCVSPGQTTLRNMCSRAADQLHKYLFNKSAQGTTYLLSFNFDCETFFQLINNIGLAHATKYTVSSRTWLVNLFCLG